MSPVGAFENVDCAGKGMPGTQGRSWAREREIRSGYSDGGQDGYAESRLEDLQKQICQELQELEEEKTREALELVKRKHKLVKWEGERERARGSGSFFWSFGKFLLWFFLIFLVT